MGCVSRKSPGHDERLLRSFPSTPVGSRIAVGIALRTMRPRLSLLLETGPLKGPVSPHTADMRHLHADLPDTREKRWVIAFDLNRSPPETAARFIVARPSTLARKAAPAVRTRCDTRYRHIVTSGYRAHTADTVHRLTTKSTRRVEIIETAAETRAASGLRRSLRCRGMRIWMGRIRKHEWILLNRYVRWRWGVKMHGTCKKICVLKCFKVWSKIAIIKGSSIWIFFASV